MCETRATRCEQERGGEPSDLRGDEQALFELYGERLLRLVAACTSASQETVEDACSFAWAQLMSKQPDRENVMGWLRVVAVHEVYRLWRKTGNELLFDAPTWLTDASTDDVARSAELDAVLEEIADLPERRRRIFELHLSGLSYREISAMTGEGPRAIDRQIKKARNRLRRDFGNS